MALSILDGNQSATTLSTILSSGQHITAHTVISLGTQAITDITSAVSGTSVCVGSISISGTPSVTGSVSVLNFPASQSTTFGAVTGSVSVLNFPASQSVTFGATTGSISVLNFPSSQAVTFSAISISNFPATQPVSLTTLPALVAGTAQIGSVTASISGTVPISISSVTVGNSLTIASLPALAAGTAQIGSVTASISNSVTIASLPAISGTVTANVFGKDYDGTAVALPILTHESNVATRGIPIGFNDNGGNTFYIVNENAPLPVAPALYDGEITPIQLGQEGDITSPNIVVPIGFAGDGEFKRVAFDAGLPISGTVTIGSLPAIGGTVTANLSISSTAITSGSFTSLTSATLVPANTARKMATVYNLGAGQLFVNAGATATTLGGGFMVALSRGDFYECDYTTTTLSAIFATAGTASWVSH